MEDKVLLLSEQDIASLLTPADIITTVEEVFRVCDTDAIVTGENGRIEIDSDGANYYMTLPAAIKPLGVAGAKWFCGYTKPKPGYPYSHGNLMILASTETGSPLAIMGAGTITPMRTAGGHCAVAAKYLARKDSETLTIIGAGVQARAALRSFLYLFPDLKHVNIYSMPKSGAEEMRSAFENRVEISVFDTAEAAVAGADILLLATTSNNILVDASWIQPGMTAMSIRAFRDLDPRLAETADKWVIGTIQEDFKQILTSPLWRQNYPLTKEMIYANLGEIVRGEKAGRETNREITVYSHMGMGALDVACAYTVYKRALEKGIGTYFTVNCF